MIKDENGKDLDLSTLMTEVYHNSKQRKKEIADLFQNVSDMITDVQTAVNLLSDATKLQQVAVNNDDTLVKLAVIMNKAQTKSKSDNDEYEITDEERRQLFKAAGRPMSDEPSPSK
jgi:hypothetical protein